MDNEYYSHFGLQVGDIWDYERSLFIHDMKQRLPDDTMRLLLDRYEALILRNQPPFITFKEYSEETVSGGSNIKGYYERHERAVTGAGSDLMKLVMLDAFSVKRDFYSRDSAIHITPSLVNLEEYQFFFALKLRQYSKALSSLHELLRSIGSEYDLEYSVAYPIWAKDALVQWKEIIPVDVANRADNIIAEIQNIKKVDSEDLIDDAFEHPNTISPEEIANDLEELFYPDNIDHYILLEELLKKEGFLDANLKWIHPDKYLVVTLYHILLTNLPWLKKLDSKNRIFLKTRFKFFNKRYVLGYKTNMFEAKYVKKYKAPAHVLEFKKMMTQAEAF